MHIEIERKFLVINDGWRSAAVAAERLYDGLVAEFDGAKVRVRLGEAKASIAVKTARYGPTRTEFEYEIPTADAKAMLMTVCGDRVIEKTRHTVEHGGFLWVVDVYAGRLAGIVLAEIELEDEDQRFSVPPWVGKEVTGDPRFRKRMIDRMCREAGRPVTISELLALGV